MGRCERDSPRLFKSLTNGFGNLLELRPITQQSVQVRRFPLQLLCQQTTFILRTKRQELHKTSMVGTEHNGTVLKDHFPLRIEEAALRAANKFLTIDFDFGTGGNGKARRSRR